MIPKTKQSTFKRLSLESLFSAGGTISEEELRGLPSIKYDCGKYQLCCIGRDVAKASEFPMWYVRGADYIRFYCFDDYRIRKDGTDRQRAVYARAVELTKILAAKNK